MKTNWKYFVILAISITIIGIVMYFTIPIFYFCGLFPLIWEVKTLLNPSRTLSFMQRCDKMKGLDTYTRNQVIILIMMILYSIWIVVGLFTSQWVFFLYILLLGIINIKENTRLLFVDALLTILSLLCIMYNKVFLHIPMKILLTNFLVKFSLDGLVILALIALVKQLYDLKLSFYKHSK